MAAIAAIQFLLNTVALVGWAAVLADVLRIGWAGLRGPGAVAAPLEAQSPVPLRPLFFALEVYCALEVVGIIYKRHIAARSMRGFVQTGLGVAIHAFRMGCGLLAIPQADAGWYSVAVVFGWAFSDVVRYLALLQQGAFLVRLRRLASAVLFPVTALGECAVSWQVIGRHGATLQWEAPEVAWLQVQFLLTLLGTPVGALSLLKMAKAGKKKSKGE